MAVFQPLPRDIHALGRCTSTPTKRRRLLEDSDESGPDDSWDIGYSVNEWLMSPEYHRRGGVGSSVCSSVGSLSSVSSVDELTTNGVRFFLEQINMGKYWDIFKTRGYDREADILILSEEDLDYLGIEDKKERNIILNAAKNYALTPEFGLHQWLGKHGLEYYFPNFVLNDLVSVNDIKKTTITEGTLDDLEITLPGHRRRLLSAVKSLGKRKRVCDSDDEDFEEDDLNNSSVAAVGFWGKPGPLNDAKNDFMCLRATMMSTKSHRYKTDLDFMVDSGSDVATIRHEILEELDLEPLACIQSKGVHATVETMMYKAKLQVGKEEIEVEVIGSTYDSIGNQVLRQFCHYVDNDKHLWLSRKRLVAKRLLNSSTDIADQSLCSDEDSDDVFLP